MATQDKPQSTADKLRESGAGTGGTAVAVQMRNLQTYFNGDARKNHLQGMLPSHIKVERLISTVLSAISNNPKLLDCTQTSIWNAAKSAAILGLEVGVSGQSYIIPYKTTATFVPGWQGLVDLVSRSGRATVWTGAVFQGDDFAWALGDTPFVKHHPNGEDDPDKLLFVYAIGRIKGSDWPVIEVWNIERIWRHRDKINKVGNAHYSYKHPEMYARKVPLLQVMKYMPKSIEISAALDAAYKAESGKGVIIDGSTFEVVEQPTDDDGALQTSVEGQTGAGAGGAPAKETKAEPKAEQKWVPTEEEKAEIKKRELAEAAAEKAGAK